MNPRSIACAVLTAAACPVFAESLTVTSDNSPFVIDADATYESVVVKSDGELTVRNAATLNAGTLTVGDSSKGTMTVTEGSTVNVTNTGANKENSPFKVGSGANSEGHFNLLDGSKLTATYGLFSYQSKAKSYLTISNAQLLVNYQVYNTRNIDTDGQRTNSVIRLEQGGSFVFGSFFRNSPGTTTLFQFDGGVCTNKEQWCSSLDGGWLVFEGVNGHPIDYAVLGGKDDGTANGYFILDGNTPSYGTPHVRLTGNGGVRLYSSVSRKAVTKTGTVPVLSAVTSDYTGDLVVTSKRLSQSAPNQLFSAKNRIVLDGVNGATAVFDMSGFDAECAGIVERNSCYVLNPGGANAVTLKVGGDNGDSELKTLLCQSPVTIRKVGTGRLDLYSDDGYGQAPQLTICEGSVDLYSRETSGYKAYKWVVSDTWGKNPNQNYLRISELELFDKVGNKVSFAEVTGGENSANLKDGNIKSDQFFDRTQFADRAPYFSIVFAYPVQVATYRFGTGCDYGPESWREGNLDADHPNDNFPPSYDVTLCRDPSDWKVYGSNDGYNWVEIGAVANYKAPNKRFSWGPSLALDYGAPLVSGALKVFKGATLNVKSGKRLVVTTAEIDGTVNYAEGVTVELKDNAKFADFSGVGAGAIATLAKSGAGDAQMLSPRTVTEVVKVGAGNLTFAANGGITNKFWRLRIKNARDWWYDPTKWDPGKTFPGGYYPTDIPAAREMALWDEDGQLVTAGTTIVSKPATVSSAVAARLFDGATDKNFWLVYVNELSEGETDTILRPEIDKPETWVTIVFRFADSAKPVRSYDFFTNNDHSDRDPGAWDLAVSDDGESWTVIDERNEIGSGEYVYRLQGTDNPTGRLTYGTYNCGEPMRFAAPVALNGPGYASTATVELGAGASLSVAGGGNVTGAIKVDASQRADGTLSFFNPAAGGTLDVENFTRGTSSLTLPFAVTESANLDNLESWTVNLNGQPTRYGLSLDNGRLSLVKPGLMLLLK